MAVSPNLVVPKSVAIEGAAGTTVNGKRMPGGRAAASSQRRLSRFGIATAAVHLLRNTRSQS
jgi:hypothetical protein